MGRKERTTEREKEFVNQFYLLIDSQSNQTEDEDDIVSERDTDDV